MGEIVADTKEKPVNADDVKLAQNAVDAVKPLLAAIPQINSGAKKEPFVERSLAEIFWQNTLDLRKSSELVHEYIDKGGNVDDALKLLPPALQPFSRWHDPRVYKVDERGVSMYDPDQLSLQSFLSSSLRKAPIMDSVFTGTEQALIFRDVKGEEFDEKFSKIMNEFTLPFLDESILKLGNYKTFIAYGRSDVGADLYEGAAGDTKEERGDDMRESFTRMNRVLLVQSMQDYIAQDYVTIPYKGEQRRIEFERELSGEEFLSSEDFANLRDFRERNSDLTLIKKDGKPSAEKDKSASLPPKEAGAITASTEVKK